MTHSQIELQSTSSKFARQPVQNHHKVDICIINMTCLPDCNNDPPIERGSPVIY